MKVWPLKWKQSHTLHCCLFFCSPQFSKEEEELSSQMSSFNEAMTQIRELEERAVEELREIIQVGAGPGQGGIEYPHLHSLQSAQHYSWNMIGALLPGVFRLDWQEAAFY